MKIPELVDCINASKQVIDIIKHNISDYEYEVMGRTVEAISTNTRLLLCRRSSGTDVRLRILLNYQNYIELDSWDCFTIYDKHGDGYEVNHENVFHLMMDNNHVLDHTQIKNLEKVSNKIDGFSIKIYLSN